MFERSIDRLSEASCADALVEVVLEQRRAGARRLALAAYWADLHTPVAEDDVDPSWPVHRQRTQTRARPGGSDGTPAVTDFAATELGVLLSMSTLSAGSLMRDALDLRHRHPRLWAAVMSGQVDWKARKVATASSRLGQEQARWVDQVTLDAVVGLPFGRAMTVVEGKVIAADPEPEQDRRQLSASQRYVAVGRTHENGLRTLIATATAGQVARIDAMVTHVADLLPTSGDDQPLEVRRANALALLANPAQACLLLAGATLDGGDAPTAGGPEEAPGSEPADCGQPADQPSAVELGAELGRVLAALAGTGGADAVWDRLRPRTVLYVHLAEEALTGAKGRSDANGAGVARVEGIGPAAGPMTLTELRRWLRSEHVTVRPVIDPSRANPVDSYEVPTHLREALTLLHPYEVFPHGTRHSRRADLDHTTPYVPPADGGPPGQTRLDNLGPLSRGHHRAKTFGGFELHQPLPGMYLWRTPTGHWHQVDHRGTHALGRATPAILSQRRGWSSLEVRYGADLEVALAA